MASPLSPDTLGLRSGSGPGLGQSRTISRPDAAEEATAEVAKACEFSSTAIHFRAKSPNGHQALSWNIRNINTGGFSSSKSGIKCPFLLTG